MAPTMVASRVEAVDDEYWNDALRSTCWSIWRLSEPSTTPSRAPTSGTTHRLSRTLRRSRKRKAHISLDRLRRADARRLGLAVRLTRLRDGDRPDRREAEPRERDQLVPRRVLEPLVEQQDADDNRDDRVGDGHGRHRRREEPLGERHLLEHEPGDPGGRQRVELPAPEDAAHAVDVERLDGRLRQARREP